MAAAENKFRFGIMGAGSIANKFCHAVSLSDGCEVSAVASKSISRAKDFAEKHGIESFYGSYEELLEQDKPDCVYIAATTDAHYELSKLCISKGVPVLCEKAMFMTYEQAKEVLTLAENTGVFAMEAMWSRFLPAIVTARRFIRSGRIGEPLYARASIGFNAPKDPANRYYDKSLGAGAMYDLGVYCYDLLTYLIDREVSVVSATASLTDTGVDLSDIVVLNFTEKGKPDCLAVCESTVIANIREEIVICGEKGKIVVPSPHFASECTLYGESGEEIERFRDDVTKNGFVYEIEEAKGCILSGRTESLVVSHSLTLSSAEVYDKLLG